MKCLGEQLRLPKWQCLRCSLDLASSLILFVLVLTSVASFAKTEADAPPDVMLKLREPVKDLNDGMRTKSESSVYEAVARIRKTLGVYAGVPESKELHLLPIDSSAPNPQALLEQVDELLGRALANLGSMNPNASNNRIELRQAAYTALLSLAMADLEPSRAALWRKRAERDLDYVLPRQHASGLFPYPAWPGSDSPPNVRAQVERLRNESPERVWDGYLVADDASAQFDTGCCSFALLSGYQVTGNFRYLESAKRAGEWGIRCPLSTNWNYNAFSVWQLAALHRATGEISYLNAALEKALIGVLPGLMENGRWVDPHNAKESYHFIMVRGLSELLRSLPPSHPRYAEVRAKTTLAAETRAREILSAGPSNIESALWGLVCFLEAVGPNEICEKAARVVVNASLAKGSLNPIATPLYLRYLKLARQNDD